MTHTSAAWARLRGDLYRRRAFLMRREATRLRSWLRRCLGFLSGDAWLCIEDSAETRLLLEALARAEWQEQDVRQLRQLVESDQRLLPPRARARA